MSADPENDGKKDASAKGLAVAVLTKKAAAKMSKSAASKVATKTVGERTGDNAADKGKESVAATKSLSVAVATKKAALRLGNPMLAKGSAATASAGVGKKVILAMEWLWSYDEDNRFVELLGIDDNFSKRAFFDRAPMDLQEALDYPDPLAPPPWIDNGAGRPKRVCIPVMGLKCARQCGFLNPTHAPRVALNAYLSRGQLKVMNFVSKLVKVTEPIRSPDSPSQDQTWRDWDSDAAEWYPMATLEHGGNKIMYASKFPAPKIVAQNEKQKPAPSEQQDKAVRRPSEQSLPPLPPGTIGNAVSSGEGAGTSNQSAKEGPEALIGDHPEDHHHTSKKRTRKKHKKKQEEIVEKEEEVHEDHETHGWWGPTWLEGCDLGILKEENAFAAASSIVWDQNRSALHSLNKALNSAPGDRKHQQVLAILKDAKACIETASLSAQGAMTLQVDRFAASADEGQIAMAKSKTMKQLVAEMEPIWAEMDGKERLVLHRDGMPGDRVRIAKAFAHSPFLADLSHLIGVLRRPDRDFECWTVRFEVPDAQGALLPEIHRPQPALVKAADTSNASGEGEPGSPQRLAKVGGAGGGPPRAAKEINQPHFLARARQSVIPEAAGAAAAATAVPLQGRIELLMCTGEGGKFWLAYVDKAPVNQEETDEKVETLKLAPGSFLLRGSQLNLQIAAAAVMEGAVRRRPVKRAPTLVSRRNREEMVRERLAGLSEKMDHVTESFLALSAATK